MGDSGGHEGMSNNIKPEPAAPAAAESPKADTVTIRPATTRPFAPDTAHVRALGGTARPATQTGPRLDSRTVFDPVQIRLDGKTCRDLTSASKKEYLLTNGIGGYSMSTIAGLNTRRYHGLLVASQKSPLQRVVVLSKMDELLTLPSGPVSLDTLAERDADATARVVESQLRGSLGALGAGDWAHMAIAYEPVWAIGTGRNATPEQAQEVHALVRRVVASLASGATADAVRVQYGGSVKADNAAALLAQPDVDGALVGGASLEAASLIRIVEAAG